MQKLLKGLTVLLALFSCGPQKHAEQIKEEVTPPLANTLLWEISGKDLSKPSYLFGTMHILCADDAKLSDSLKAAIQSIETIFFEINMDDMSQMLGALKYIRMNGNKRLPDLLSKEDYKKVQDYFEKNKPILPLSMMESFKPYFLAAMLSEQKMPCPAKEGMEQVIMKEAKMVNKPIKGLETIAFQASIFDSIPYDQQAKELVKLIESDGTDDKKSEQLLEVYRQQDLQKMQDLTVQEEGLINKNLDLLLYNRNARWAKQIDSIVHAKPTLFAVGAAHLPGPKGVIMLLRKEGYVVRGVKN